MSHLSHSSVVHGNGHTVELPQLAPTKTVPPAVGRFVVERRRLLDALEDASSRRLILIKAPAGYGKTTLAADWCCRLRKTDAIVAWLGLDGDDNEPGTFAYHLAMAVSGASTDLGEKALGLLHASTLIPARNVIVALVNAASDCDSEIFLFLDDFHLVTDLRCHDLTSLLLRYAPSNLHLVIMSRVEPRLPLSKLHLADDIVEIDTNLLRFDLAETEQFLGADLSGKLRPPGLSKLYAATEGWPAALQLARISLRNSPDPRAHVSTLSGSSQKISAYLDDTLASQPEEIVRFLLQTSILNQFNAALCEAVTRMPEAAELLRALERQQLLLVSTGEAEGWYRYHRLLSEFLGDRLHSRMSDQVGELHRRAYVWFADKEMWREAVHHATAAKDFDRAVRFIEKCAMALVAKGDLLTLLCWERQLPVELMGGQLRVKLALAWGMALVTRFSEANKLLTQVEEASGTDRDSDLYWNCRAVRAALHGLADDSESAREVAMDCLRNRSFDPSNFNSLCNLARYGHWKAGDRDAFDALPKPDLAADESSYVLAETYRLCLCGMIAVQELRCDEALGFYSAAKHLAEKHVGAGSVSAAMAAGLMANVLYERGDVSGAEIAVLDHFDLIETTVFHESFLQAFLVLVRAALIRGDGHRAISLLNRAERLAWERGWGRIVAALLLERVRVLSSERRHDQTQSILQSLAQLKEKHPAPVRCSWSDIHTCSTVCKGLLALAAGSAGEAVRHLAAAYDELLSMNDRIAALRVGLELSIAHLRNGSTTKSFDVLKQVLRSASEANFVSFVFERRAEAARLLAAADDNGVFAGRGPLHHFASDLLKRLREQETPQEALAGTKLGLTDRERAIVEFIARGQSNKEIARELGVAPETIKTHVKRIFRKLSAESRTQAVIRAQSLGLLSGA